MIDIRDNVPLAPLTSWKVGGSAEHFFSPQTEEEVGLALQWAHENGHKVTVLSGGTNVLVSDRGIDGLVLYMNELRGIEILNVDNPFIVEVLAGTPKSDVLKEFLKRKLPPAIFLAGLPGDIGGGVVMNAGVGYEVEPREFCELVESFKVVECDEEGVLHEKFFHREGVEWAYRKSSGWQPGVITRVQLSWKNLPDDDVLTKVREANNRRKSTQPLSFPSCGSTFKNPEGKHAGFLIEEAGLKGLQVGGIQVSEKHANFLVNTGTGTAEDVHNLIQKIQEKIKEKYSVDLQTEAVYLGEWS